MEMAAASPQDVSDLVFLNPLPRSISRKADEETVKNKMGVEFSGA